MTDYNDGKFHLWHGGECPVHPQAVVDVRFHSVESQADGLHPAKDWEWRHIGYGMDIVAFRVVKPYRATPTVQEAAKVLLAGLGDFERDRSHPSFEAAFRGYADSNKPAPFNRIGDGLIAALRAIAGEIHD